MGGPWQLSQVATTSEQLCLLKWGWGTRNLSRNQLSQSFDWATDSARRICTKVSCRKGPIWGRDRAHALSTISTGQQDTDNSSSQLYLSITTVRQESSPQAKISPPDRLVTADALSASVPCPSLSLVVVDPLFPLQEAVRITLDMPTVERLMILVLYLSPSTFLGSSPLTAGPMAPASSLVPAHRCQ